MRTGRRRGSSMAPGTGRIVERGALVAAALFSALLAAPAIAQPVAGTEAGVAVSRVKEAARRIHEFHGRFLRAPKEAYYCETMEEGEAALFQITLLARRAVAAGQPALALRLTAIANDLSDELAEEDALVDEFGPPDCPSPFVPRTLSPAERVGGHEAFNGFSLATYTVLNSATLHTTETFAATAAVTNRFTDN